jgi:hypothetical protein
MPDVQGNVDLFGDTDVADVSDGKIFSVNRRAPEGDTYIRLFCRADQYAVIDSNWDMEINSNAAAGRIKIGAVATNIVNLLGSNYNSVGWGNGTDNPLWRHYGYITAVSSQRYVQYKVDDTDDYFWLTRQGADILGFKIGMPVDIQGSLSILDANDIILGTTTGSKIGTATNQKIGFWNAAPVVQPTTGIAEAAFVENAGGTAINVDSTFGGYTLQQVVKALQTVGILA